MPADQRDPAGPPDDVVDLVRARLQLGFARENLPLRLQNESGIDPKATERALAVIDAEERRALVSSRRKWLAFGGALVLLGALLDATLGTALGIGSFLLICMGAVICAGLAWLLHEVRNT